MRQENVRESNFELLRIISMFMIILNHYVEHGLNLETMQFSFDLNLIFVWMMKYGGKFGCFLFILITGYFMAKSSFKLNKFILLIFEIWFYSVAIYFVLAVAKVIPLSGKNVIKALIPLEGSWFIKVYLLIYVLTIFINPMVKALSKEKLLTLIGVLVFVSSFLPTFFGKDLFGFGRIDYFVLMYMTGAYLRLHPSRLMTKKIFWFCAFAVCYLGYIGLCVVTYKSGRDPFLFSQIFSFTSIGGAIALFIMFKNIHFSNLQINSLATTMLGVYLLHDNMMLRDVLWGKLFQVEVCFSSQWFVCFALGSGILILIICSAIDYARNRFLEKYIRGALEKNTYLNKVNICLERFIEE